MRGHEQLVPQQHAQCPEPVNLGHGDRVHVGELGAVHYVGEVEGGVEEDVEPRDGVAEVVDEGEQGGGEVQDAGDDWKGVAGEDGVVRLPGA